MILDFFNMDKIANLPWDYDFLLNLDEKEYPKYLRKFFKLNTYENLPLRYDFKTKALIIDKKRCKTFNQKIQWLKLYGVTDLMRQCTDKVAVRDYVKEKIGEEYLKPVLQICDNFDQIDFNKLPNAFVIKCNHGCKWHYIIKNKKEYLNTPRLIEIIKRQMTGWLEQEFFPWNGFEMQYYNIKPKILIEPFLRQESFTNLIKINIYCFNEIPKIFIKFFDNGKMSIWNEKFEPLDNIFNFSEENIKTEIEDYINQTFYLSSKLAKNFKFVRCDWMIYKNKLYFEELTFTPYSGFLHFLDKNINKQLGDWINLERLNYEIR